MKRGYFITGTDTNIGKTTITAALARAFKERGLKVGVMKPVESGCKTEGGQLVPADALCLKEAAGSDDKFGLINPYHFSLPLAPKLAAEASDTEIDLGWIQGCFSELSEGKDLMLVESAGGILVPLTGTKTTVDLMLMLGLELIVVTPSRLGCINQTLLTVRFAELVGLKVAGVILNHPDERIDESQKSNANEISNFGVTVLGTIPCSKDDAEPLNIESFINLDLLLGETEEREEE
ncbi:MAG: dethiobiotin synthase [Deltaproteobacteria bacterium]|nr:dethiobiotin synthase [Deltaproteobacteria bacterium]